MKKYEILGGNLPVVVCELSAGESMITESGSMSWMSPNMKMETISGGGMKKMFGRLMSGDSAFQNRYTAEGADGMIAFASSFPGAIKALEFSSGHSMIVQKSAFLASEEGVELSMHFQKKLGKGKKSLMILWMFGCLNMMERLIWVMQQQMKWRWLLG